LKSSDAIKSTGDAGGVAIKKFTVNAAKEQLILEFNIGAAKKKEGEPESKASAGGKAKDAPANTKKTARAGFCPYDNVPAVSSRKHFHLANHSQHEFFGSTRAYASICLRFRDNVMSAGD
jgi:hypothetical protein